MKRYWAYIMSNKSRKLYVGFTSDLAARVTKHKLKLYPTSFTARYCFDMLVWCERPVCPQFSLSPVFLHGRRRLPSPAMCPARCASFFSTRPPEQRPGGSD